MANTNVKGTPTALLDTRLWAGSPTDSTAWLQSPIGSNEAVGTMSMAVIELVADDGDAATAYDITGSGNASIINPVIGTELIAVMSIISSAEEDGTAGAASAIPVAGNLSSPTAIKFTGAGANGKDTTYRIAFLYR
jgi:hypothetical protein